VLSVDFIEFADALPEALCLIDSSGKILHANKAAAKFLELDVDALLESSLFQWVCDSKEKLEQIIRNWSRSRNMVPGAIDMRGNNNQTIHCNCNGCLIRPKTKNSGAIILVRLENRESFSKNFSALNLKIEQLTKEIIERRNTQHALVKSRAEFVAIFNAIPDAVVFADLDRRIVMVNPAFISVFGYSEQELIGNTTELIYVSKDDFLDLGRRRYRKGPGTEKGVYEIQYRRKNGLIFWADTLGTKVVNDKGETIGFSALIRDISERKKTEVELSRYRENLEQLVQRRTHKLKSINRELEAFSYSVSHDLRSPLRGIDGFSLALLEDYSDVLDDEGKYFLGRIRHNAQFMARLIDDLLELSRIPRMDFRMEDLDLSDIAESVAQRLRETDPQRKVDVRIAPGIIVKSDKTLLTVAIENLLGNAWKYTCNSKNAKITLGCKTIDSEMVYFVTDNGVGFDMRFADKLFGAFQRMHVSQEFEGTGIGLATVNRIIERHGGRIWATSKIGKGTTLFFTLSSKGKNVGDDTVSHEIQQTY